MAVSPTAMLRLKRLRWQVCAHTINGCTIPLICPNSDHVFKTVDFAEIGLPTGSCGEPLLMLSLHSASVDAGSYRRKKRMHCVTRDSNSTCHPKFSWFV